MYRIIVDTEDYAGNFERDMIAYAIACEGGPYDSNDYAEVIAEEDPPMHHSWWQQHVKLQLNDDAEPFPDDDYDQEDDMVLAQIYPTRGWMNNGVGGHFRVHSDQARLCVHHHPAYCSVSFLVDEQPPSDVWTEFQERIKRFCDTECLGLSQKTPIILTGCRQEYCAPAPKPKHKMS